MPNGTGTQVKARMAREGAREYGAWHCTSTPIRLRDFGGVVPVAVFSF